MGWHQALQVDMKFTSSLLESERVSFHLAGRTYASVNPSSAYSLPGITGEFFLITRPGGWALVHPGAFDGLVITYV